MKIALSKGVDAYGVDFNIPRLKELHERIGIRDRMSYCQEDLDLSTVLINLKRLGAEIQGVTLLDTLRYIYDFEDVFQKCNDYDVRIILIKEVSAAMRRKRRSREEWYLFSIRSLIAAAKRYNYSVLKLYLSKFMPIPAWTLSFCQKFGCLGLFECSPTFTIIFKANER